MNKFKNASPEAKTLIAAVIAAIECEKRALACYDDALAAAGEAVANKTLASLASENALQIKAADEAQAESVINTKIFANSAKRTATRVFNHVCGNLKRAEMAHDAACEAVAAALEALNNLVESEEVILLEGDKEDKKFFAENGNKYYIFFEQREMCLLAPNGAQNVYKDVKRYSIKNSHIQVLKPGFELFIK